MNGGPSQLAKIVTACTDVLISPYTACGQLVDERREVWTVERGAAVRYDGKRDERWG